MILLYILQYRVVLRYHVVLQNEQ